MTTVKLSPKIVVLVLSGVLLVTVVLEATRRLSDFRIIDLVLQGSAAGLGVALAYWLTRWDLGRSQAEFTQAVEDRLQQVNEQIAYLRTLDSSQTSGDKELHEFKQTVAEVAGPKRDAHQTANLVSELSTRSATNFGIYGGRIASRDPRLLVALYLTPQQEQLLKKSTHEANAELTRFQADEATKVSVSEIFGEQHGRIPLTAQTTPRQPSTTGAAPTKKTAQQYDVPPDSVLQPSYAVGKGLITQEEYINLKNEYFAQCELTLGLILPLILLAFALSYQFDERWRIFVALIVVCPVAGVLFLAAWDRWFKYRLELKLLILGRWDKGREAAEQGKEPKPKPDSSVIQKVVQEELKKLHVEVKPLVVELHREQEGPGPKGSSAKEPGR